VVSPDHQASTGKVAEQLVTDRFPLAQTMRIQYRGQASGMIQP
jgi:hypothetical protein